MKLFENIISPTKNAAKVILEEMCSKSKPDVLSIFLSDELAGHEIVDLLSYSGLEVAGYAIIRGYDSIDSVQEEVDDIMKRWLTPSIETKHETNIYLHTKSFTDVNLNKFIQINNVAFYVYFQGTLVRDTKNQN